MLIDDIRHDIETGKYRDRQIGGLDSRGLLSNLKTAYVIDAQNVSNYMFAESADKKLWSIRAFPNVAPPFPVMWVESKTPPEIGGEKFERIQTGVLLISGELTDRTVDSLVRSNWKIPQGIDLHSEYRWATEALVFCRSERSEYWRSQGSLMWLIKPSGELHAPNWELLYTMNPWAVENARAIAGEIAGKMGYSPNESPQKLLSENIKVNCFSPLLALTFMHCKKVQVERAPAVSEKLQKARISRGKPRLTRPHVIYVNPVRALIKSATGDERITPKSLHIVRGHFRTYDENPLFGKFKGTFWIPLHTAGTTGESFKNTYKINSPEVA